MLVDAKEGVKEEEAGHDRLQWWPFAKVMVKRSMHIHRFVHQQLRLALLRRGCRPFPAIVKAQRV